MTMTTDLFEILERETGWSKELLFQLVENVKDYAIFVSDVDGRIVSWNAGAEKLFGYAADEAIGRKVNILFTSEDRANDIPEKEMRTAVSDGVAEDERWHLRKDGSRFFASGLQTPLYDRSGEHTGYAKIARDLTERIEAQEDLLKALGSVEAKVQERTGDLNASNESLRVEVGKRKEADKLRAALLRKIVQTQEDERKRIARDMHDHVGQQMTALQLKLQLLLDKYKSDPAISGDVAELKSIANQIDSEVDFLTWELRPSVLDDLGLAAAVAQYVDEWSDHFGTHADFENVGLDGMYLTPEIEISLYRIAQEALNNIAKYAKAKHVSVLLERRDGTVSLIVEDDGVGFNASEKTIFTGNDRGMGLMGMKERAELVAGAVEIETSVGRGTTVFVRVPARFDEHRNAEDPL